MAQNLNPVNFSTGPVFIHPDVVEAFGGLPVSHRNPAFVTSFNELQQKLCSFTGARYVQLLNGSGTLANEAMLAQIKTWNEPGLVLNNGEFGNRLMRQCQRQGIAFTVFSKNWGHEFNLNEIEWFIERNSDIKWILFTHCESSTGVIINLEQICQMATRRNIKVCVDAMSTIGNTATPFNKVELASCSTGKGLGSYAGLGLVFSNRLIEPNEFIPGYIDLGNYFKNKGVPFTISSNLVFALHAAIKHTLTTEHLHQNRQLASQVLKGLNDLKTIQVLNTSYQNPSHIFTLVPQNGVRSVELGNLLLEQGIETSYNSRYLIKRNFLQIAVMSLHESNEIALLLDRLQSCMKVLLGKN